MIEIIRNDRLSAEVTDLTDLAREVGVFRRKSRSKEMMALTGVRPVDAKQHKMLVN